MKTLLFLLFTGCSLPMLGQKAADSLLDAILQRRNNTASFRNTLEMIAEPSTISGAGITEWNTSGKKSYVLHADIQMPIALGGKRYSFGGRGKGYWMNTLQAIPQFKVRIFRDDAVWGDSSLPVRTPSYLPRLTYFGAPSGLHNVYQRSNMEYEHLHFLGISVYHHSNGQDGAEFRGDSVNIYNGNFSENAVFQFLVGGYYRKGGSPTTFQRITREETLSDTTEVKTFKTIYAAATKAVHQSWKAGFEWHPAVLSNKVFARAGVYGGNRLQGQYTLIISPVYQEKIHNGKTWKNIGTPKQKELFRLVLNMEYITDMSFYKGTLNKLQKIAWHDASKRLNINATAYMRIPGTAHAAGFLSAAYWGSDNYNVYFQKSQFQVRGGLAFSFFDFPSRQGPEHEKH